MQELPRLLIIYISFPLAVVCTIGAVLLGLRRRYMPAVGLTILAFLLGVLGYIGVAAG
jgi:hypothetical protein